MQNYGKTAKNGPIGNMNNNLYFVFDARKNTITLTLIISYCNDLLQCYKLDKMFVDILK